MTNKDLKMRIIAGANDWFESAEEPEDESQLAESLRQDIRELFKLEPEIERALIDNSRYTIGGLRRYLLEEATEGE